MRAIEKLWYQYELSAGDRSSKDWTREHSVGDGCISPKSNADIKLVCERSHKSDHHLR